MQLRRSTLAFAISSTLIASQSLAAPKFFGDARAIAMGGTGVASAVATSASFFNPALVAAKQDDSRDGFGLMLPSIHILAADEEEVVTRLENYQDSNLFDNLETAINVLNSSATDAQKIAAANQILAAANQIDEDLTGLNGDAVKFEIGVGSSIVIPGNKFGVAVFTNGTVKGTTTVDYNDGDTYNYYITEATKIANDDPDALDSLPTLTQDDIESEGFVIAAAKAEVGITFAREFEIGDNTYAIGISPKYQIFRAYDYRANVETFSEDDFDAADYEAEETAFNLDIGAAAHFGAEDQWTVGFSGMNVIPVDFNTSEAAGIAAGTGREIDVQPLYRVGVAHTSEWHTVAIDLDLTKNKAFGFEDDAQFIAIGGEFDAFDTLQLRAGVRHNLASANGRDGVHEDTQLTAGLGLSPLGIHMDISGLISDGQYGAAAELSVTF